MAPRLALKSNLVWFPWNPSWTASETRLPRFISSAPLWAMQWGWPRCVATSGSFCPIGISSRQVWSGRPCGFWNVRTRPLCDSCIGLKYLKLGYYQNISALSQNGRCGWCVSNSAMKLEVAYFRRQCDFLEFFWTWLELERLSPCDLYIRNGAFFSAGLVVLQNHWSRSWTKWLRDSRSHGRLLSNVWWFFFFHTGGFAPLMQSIIQIRRPVPEWLKCFLEFEQKLREIAEIS